MNEEQQYDCSDEEKQKKQSVKEETTNDNKAEPAWERISITQHEDTVLKTLVRNFGEEILRFFKIEGKIKDIVSTEPVYVEIRKMYEDFNFRMEDGTLRHIEFQSRDGGEVDLRRFRSYEAVSGELEGAAVTTYVLFQVM